VKGSICSSCAFEHNNPDSLDARLFPSVVLAVAPAVTMDEASSLSGFTLVAKSVYIHICICMYVCMYVYCI